MIMPGAFAHITAVNLASEGKTLKNLNISNKAKFIISQNIEFIELGCVSPDYPYLKIGDKEQNEWADKMHYSNVGVFIRKAIALIKELDGIEKEKTFAWLCGYVGHVIADITIHPVVQLKVGPYRENAKEHRICEMNQDTYIWERLNLGEQGLADRVKANIGSCVETSDPSKVDVAISQLWLSCLTSTFPDEVKKCKPEIDEWHKGFQFVVDNVEEGYRLFPFARHLAAKAGIVYPSREDVDMGYIKSLETPKGSKDYDEVFDLAVSNICLYWEYLSNAIFSEADDSMFLNWDLDTGLSDSNELTAWS